MTTTSKHIPDNLSFKQKQAMAYTFLKAFYTSKDLGYNVDRYKHTDVTQEIIDVVNEMGHKIVTTNRIVQFANLFKTIAEGLTSTPEFIASLIIIVSSGDLNASIQSILLSVDKLVEERETIRRNVLAYNLTKQILNREKGYIELKFNGF